METKYYQSEVAIQMLPLIKAYCRDIKKMYADASELIAEGKRLSNMTAPSESGREDLDRQREEIREELKRLEKRYLGWKKELAEMHISVCNPRLGKVDVPIYCDSMLAMVVFCVDEDTTGEEMHWHQHGESCEMSKPYYEEVL